MSSSCFDLLVEIQRHCNDITGLILEYLDVSSLSNLFLTCKNLAKYSKTKNFWSSYMRKQYTEHPFNPKRWRHVYSDLKYENAWQLIVLLDREVGYTKYRGYLEEKRKRAVDLLHLNSPIKKRADGNAKLKPIVNENSDDSAVEDPDESVANEIIPSDEEDYDENEPPFYIEAGLLGLEKLVCFYLQQKFVIPYRMWNHPKHIGEVLIKFGTEENKSDLLLQAGFGTLEQFKRISWKKDFTLKHNGSIIYSPIINGNIEILRFVTEEMKLEKDDGKFLETAIRYDQLEVFKFLTADTKTVDSNLLVDAAAHSFRIFQYCCEELKCRSVKGKTHKNIPTKLGEVEFSILLQEAAGMYQLDTVEYLWEDDIDEDEYDQIFNIVYDADMCAFPDTDDCNFSEEGYIAMKRFLLQKHPELTDKWVEKELEYKYLPLIPFLEEDLLGYAYLPKILAESEGNINILKLALGMTNHKGIIEKQDLIPLPYRKEMMRIALSVSVEAMEILLDRGCKLPSRSTLLKLLPEMDHRVYKSLESKIKLTHKEIREILPELIQRGSSLARKFIEENSFRQAFRDELLRMAISVKSIGMIRLLRKEGADYLDDPISIFRSLTSRTEYRTFEFLIRDVPKSKKYQKKIFRVICEQGHPYCMTVFMNAGLRPDITDKKAIYSAIRSGNSEKVERLIRLGFGRENVQKVIRKIVEEDPDVSLAPAVLRVTRLSSSLKQVKPEESEDDI